jgi:hypothetical protein
MDGAMDIGGGIAAARDGRAVADRNQMLSNRETRIDEIESSYTSPVYPTLPDRETADWQYVMRRTMQEIIPGVYLGEIMAYVKTLTMNYIA